MMYLPAIFGESLMDDWMDDFDKGFMSFDRDFEKEFNRGFGKKNPLFGKHAANLMKTDVRENEKSYDVNIDIPGFKKDEIHLDLQNGYLTVAASKGLDRDKQDKKGRIIRQERYAGSMQRSFYIGDMVTNDEVKAKFEDGVLKLMLPKNENKVPEKHTIMIEG